MKVLVTGREGQLVRSLIERSQNRDGISLAALGRPDLDLGTPGSAADAIARFAPDVVINAAAYTAVDQAEDEPDAAFRINGDAAGEVAAAARKAGARIIHISTDYVFDGQGEGAYAEDAPVCPLGVYGRSKLAGEEQVRSNNPDHVIVRTAWVYSPFGKNFLKTMVALGQTRDLVTVVADQYGNPTSALDLADGLLAIIDRWSGGETVGLGETYHLAGTGFASWYEFAGTIFAELRALGLPSAEVQPLRTVDWPTKAVRPQNSRLDGSKFRRDIGFAMPDWQASTREVIARLAASSPRGMPV
jgi:dTDP-4-dehydrorhamnose reductase